MNEELWEAQYRDLLTSFDEAVIREEACHTEMDRKIRFWMTGRGELREPDYARWNAARNEVSRLDTMIRQHLRDKA